MRLGMAVCGLAALVSTSVGSNETDSPLDLRPAHSLSIKKPSFDFSALNKKAQSSLQKIVQTRIEDLYKKGLLAQDERVAFALYELDNGKHVSINENEPMRVASTAKSLVHLVMQQQPTYLESSTAQNLVYLMLAKSDNDVTNFVMAELGGPKKIQEFLSTRYGLVFRQTKIVDYIPRGGADYTTMGSAGDYIRYMYLLHTTELEGSKELLQALAFKKKNPHRLFASVNGPSIIHNKTGTTAHACSDMGSAQYEDSIYLSAAIIQKSKRSEEDDKWMNRCANNLRELSHNLITRLYKAKSF